MSIVSPVIDSMYGSSGGFFQMIQFESVLPVIVLGVGALLLFVADVFKSALPEGMRSSPTVWLFSRSCWCIVLCICAWICSIRAIQLGQVAKYYNNSLPEVAYWHGSVYADAFSFVFTSLILGSTIFYFLLAGRLICREEGGERLRDTAEVDVLVLLATIGGIVFVQAGDLIVLFVGLELLSICVYVLVGLVRREKASAEAALKYFILGAFSSAFFLYGAALVYGATGFMQFHEIGNNADAYFPMLSVGCVLMLCGFAFKLGVFPFHMWVPDVYQGSPTSTTVIMASMVKISAIGAMLRVVTAFGALPLEIWQLEIWQPMIWVMAVGSMVVGNFGALRQRSVKRMLAYSSIAHAGYLFMGFLALGESGGAEAIVFYALVYGVMTIATFGVILLISSGTQWQYERDDVSVFSGLGWSSPFLGFVMAVGLFSLAGLPPFAGFIGKLYLFKAVISQGYWGIAVIAALNSFVSLYYYLRVVVFMYFGEGLLCPNDHDSKMPSLISSSSMCRSLGSRFAVVVACVLIIGLGMFPDNLLQLASIAVRSL